MSSHTSRSSHHRSKDKGKGHSSHKNFLPGCKLGSRCVPAPGGCAAPTKEDVRKLYPGLGIIYPWPEPDPDDEPSHRDWRQHYSKWKNTIICPCGRGYFCRVHALWVRGHEAADEYQRERDQYGYPNCPGWHFNSEEDTGDVEYQDNEAPNLPGRDTTHEVAQEMEQLNLGTATSYYPPDSPQHHDQASPTYDNDRYSTYDESTQLQSPNKYSYGSSRNDGNHYHNPPSAGYEPAQHTLPPLPQQNRTYEQYEQEFSSSSQSRRFDQYQYPEPAIYDASEEEYPLASRLRRSNRDRTR